MDIAVVGPGAVGTTVAAYLSAAGHPVLVCGRTPRPQIELRPDDADPIAAHDPRGETFDDGGGTKRHRHIDRFEDEFAGRPRFLNPHIDLPDALSALGKISRAA